MSRTRHLAVLSSALTQGVRKYYLCDRNVVRDVALEKNPPRDRLITSEELEALKAMATNRVRLAIMLAVTTAQRQSDILAFKWSDVYEGALHLRQGKTGKRLAIELSRDLKTVFGQCWQLGPKSDYILPTHTGAPYTPEGFRSCWQRVHRAWVATGHSPLHFHDLRALAATRCKDPETARRLLGHTTIAMTQRVYRRGEERVEALNLT